MNLSKQKILAVHFAKQKTSNYFLLLQNRKSVGEKNWEAIWIPARIPPQTPPAGGKSVEAKRKILFPRKTDFRFAESALKPHALPRNFLGRTPKEKHPFLFPKKFHPRQIKKARSVFLSGLPRLCEAVAERYERTRQFRVTTRSARAISRYQGCFQNTFELCTMNTART